MRESENNRIERICSELERRRHFRVECRIPARFRVAPDGVEGDLTIVNIGLGGARIAEFMSLAVGSEILLTLPPRHEGASDRSVPQIEVRAQVSWAATPADEDCGPAGLRFFDLDRVTARKLVAYILPWL